MYHNQKLTPTFNSSTIVLAEKYQQLQQAQRQYYRMKKTGLIKDKQSALNELQQIQGEMDNLVYNILHKPESLQSARTFSNQ
jgi:hypothetical protein